MSDRSLLSDPTYDPNRLLDTLLKHMHMASDAALARALELTPPAISKMRHRRIPLVPPGVAPIKSATVDDLTFR